MHNLSIVIDVVLAVYIVWEVARFLSRYRQLKQALANGDAQARASMYNEVLAFEWISALLALAALGFDWSKLNPKFLALESIPLIHLFSQGGVNQAILTGMLVGIVGGTVGAILFRLKANRRGAAPAVDAHAPWWRKLAPDFSALLPVTRRERYLWAAAAISAGICEEIVFRGWLLSTLHSTAKLSGWALILITAALFGLAHAYQGVTGVLATAFAGLFFCVLYVVTGSLLVPILLHALVDLRFAFLPAPQAQKPQAAYA
jgi:uncharacterized protein